MQQLHLKYMPIGDSHIYTQFQTYQILCSPHSPTENIIDSNLNHSTVIITLSNDCIWKIQISNYLPSK